MKAVPVGYFASGTDMQHAFRRGHLDVPVGVRAGHFGLDHEGLPVDDFLDTNILDKNLPRFTVSREG